MGRDGGNSHEIVLLLVILGVHETRRPIHGIAGIIQPQLGTPGGAFVLVGSVYRIDAADQVLVEPAPVFRIDHAGDGGEFQVIVQVMFDINDGDQRFIFIVLRQVVAEIAPVVRPEARAGVDGR